jgi:peroxin-6
MLTRHDRFTLHPSLSLSRVSRSLPFTYTGADMYALCSDAMLKAITRSARAVDEKVKTYNQNHNNSNNDNNKENKTITIAYFFDHLATEDDTAVLVTERDFLDAHKELVPSVSADELAHYDGVRQQFEGAGTKEDGKGKGKGKAIDEVENMVIRTGNTEVLNGNGSGGSGKGQGKGLVSNHVGNKSSVDIAEGGFGHAGMDDDLYS